MRNVRPARITCFLGAIAIASGLLTIAVSIMINPWFSLMKGALSDLGRVGLSTAWVFNSGLLITSLIAEAYVYCLVKAFKHSVSHVAAGIYLVSVAYLILIALFPEGTTPHLIVSYEFFLMMMITYLTYSISLWVEGLRRHSVLSFLAFAVALLGSAGIKWPSTAVLELFNIGAMTYWYLLMLHAALNSLRSS